MAVLRTSWLTLLVLFEISAHTQGQPHRSMLRQPQRSFAPFQQSNMDIRAAQAIQRRRQYQRLQQMALLRHRLSAAARQQLLTPQRAHNSFWDVSNKAPTSGPPAMIVTQTTKMPIQQTTRASSVVKNKSDQSLKARLLERMRVLARKAAERKQLSSSGTNMKLLSKTTLAPNTYAAQKKIIKQQSQAPEQQHQQESWTLLNSSFDLKKSNKSELQNENLNHSPSLNQVTDSTQTTRSNSLNLLPIAPTNSWLTIQPSKEPGRGTIDLNAHGVFTNPIAKTMNPQSSQIWVNPNGQVERFSALNETSAINPAMKLVTNITQIVKSSIHENVGGNDIPYPLESNYMDNALSSSSVHPVFPQRNVNVSKTNQEESMGYQIVQNSGNVSRDIKPKQNGFYMNNKNQTDVSFMPSENNKPNTRESNKNVSISSKTGKETQKVLSWLIDNLVAESEATTNQTAISGLFIEGTDKLKESRHLKSEEKKSPHGQPITKVQRLLHEKTSGNKNHPIMIEITNINKSGIVKKDKVSSVHHQHFENNFQPVARRPLLQSELQNLGVHGRQDYDIKYNHNNLHYDDAHSQFQHGLPKSSLKDNLNFSQQQQSLSSHILNAFNNHNSHAENHFHTGHKHDNFNNKLIIPIMDTGSVKQVQNEKSSNTKVSNAWSTFFELGNSNVSKDAIKMDIQSDSSKSTKQPYVSGKKSKETQSQMSENNSMTTTSPTFYQQVSENNSLSHQNVIGNASIISQNMSNTLGIASFKDVQRMDIYGNLKNISKGLNMTNAESNDQFSTQSLILPAMSVSNFQQTDHPVKDMTNKSSMPNTQDFEQPYILFKDKTQDNANGNLLKHIPESLSNNKELLLPAPVINLTNEMQHIYGDQLTSTHASLTQVLTTVTEPNPKYEFNQSYQNRKSQIKNEPSEISHFEIKNIIPENTTIYDKLKDSQQQNTQVSDKETSIVKNISTTYMNKYTVSPTTTLISKMFSTNKNDAQTRIIQNKTKFDSGHQPTQLNLNKNHDRVKFFEPQAILKSANTKILKKSFPLKTLPESLSNNKSFENILNMQNTTSKSDYYGYITETLKNINLDLTTQSSLTSQIEGNNSQLKALPHKTPFNIEFGKSGLNTKSDTKQEIIKHHLKETHFPSKHNTNFPEHFLNNSKATLMPSYEHIKNQETTENQNYKNLHLFRTTNMIPPVLNKNQDQMANNMLDLNVYKTKHNNIKMESSNMNEYYTTFKPKVSVNFKQQYPDFVLPHSYMVSNENSTKPTVHSAYENVSFNTFLNNLTNTTLNKPNIKGNNYIKQQASVQDIDLLTQNSKGVENSKLPLIRDSEKRQDLFTHQHLPTHFENHVENQLFSKNDLEKKLFSENKKNLVKISPQKSTVATDKFVTVTEEPMDFVGYLSGSVKNQLASESIQVPKKKASATNLFGPSLETSSHVISRPGQNVIVTDMFESEKKINETNQVKPFSTHPYVNNPDVPNVNSVMLFQGKEPLFQTLTGNNFEKSIADSPPVNFIGNIHGKSTRLKEMPNMLAIELEHYRGDMHSFPNNPNTLKVDNSQPFFNRPQEVNALKHKHLHHPYITNDTLIPENVKMTQLNTEIAPSVMNKKDYSYDSSGKIQESYNNKFDITTTVRTSGYQHDFHGNSNVYHTSNNNQRPDNYEVPRMHEYDTTSQHSGNTGMANQISHGQSQSTEAGAMHLHSSNDMMMKHQPGHGQYNEYLNIGNSHHNKKHSSNTEHTMQSKSQTHSSFLESNKGVGYTSTSEVNNFYDNIGHLEFSKNIESLQHNVDQEIVRLSGQRSIIQTENSANLSISEKLYNQAINVWLHEEDPCVSPGPGYPGFDHVTKIDSDLLKEFHRRMAMRLPKTTVPISYQLEIKPDFYDTDPNNFYHSGSVVIQIVCMRTTNAITLHSRGLYMKRSSMKLQPIDSNEGLISVIDVSFDVENDFLVLTTNKHLLVNKEYKIYIEFAAPILDNGVAMHFISNYENSTRYAVATRFSPVFARNTFPCYDEPEYTAIFTITVIRKQTVRSFSNTYISGQDIKDKDWIVDRYAPTSIPISPHSVLILVGELDERIATTDLPFQTRLLASTGLTSVSSYLLSLVEPASKFLHQIFQAPFPQQKFDIFSLKHGEDSSYTGRGISVMSHLKVSFSENKDPAIQKQEVAKSLTCTLTQQWLSTLPSHEWWSSLWIHKALTTYISYHVVEHLIPKSNMEQQFIVDVTHQALLLDTTQENLPLERPVKTIFEILTSVDTLTHTKGAALFKMLEFILGTEAFYRGIRVFFNGVKWQNAKHNIWIALETQSIVSHNQKNDIQRFVQEWTSQNSYPIVNIQRYGPNKMGILVEQQPHASVKSQATNLEQRWEIPLTFTTSTNPTFNHSNENIIWLPRNGNMVYIHNVFTDNPKSWILANIQQHGYYRVNYDKQNWENLIWQLKFNHQEIHPINRGQIIDDAWNLARAGEITISIALQTLEYLEQEDSYIVWKAAFEEIMFLKKMLQGEDLDLFVKFIQRKINPQYMKFAPSNQGTSHVEILKRVLISDLACAFSLSECLREATYSFGEEMNVNKGLNPSLRDVFYCTAISEGGQSEWNWLLSKLHMTIDDIERRSIIKALGCTQEIMIINSYLQLMFDEEAIRAQEIPSALKALYGSQLSRFVLVNFLKENWLLITKRFGKKNSQDEREILLDLLSYVNTDDELSVMSLWFHSDEVEGMYPHLAAVRKKLDWFHVNKNLISQWLYRNVL